MTSSIVGGLQNWEETGLWQLIKRSDKPDSESIRATLQIWMPRIQNVLAHGGTSPTDFTLHDSQHSYRVAQRMIEVIPADVLPQLSLYELSLLLLSAYLHDIGMTPEQSKVKLYFEYLVTAEPRDLSKSELARFQRWLDEQSEDWTPPVEKGPTSASDLHQASLLVARYCRERHVDWSEDWILANMGEVRLVGYLHWIKDLMLLCRSHHEGYTQLISDSFDPKLVANKNVVHLRYLAIVLRVADIMEFDPERTPEVIFKHRDISPQSAIFWHKDHFVSYVFEGGRLTISAEPPNAHIHHAIELMCNDIESELRLVRRIDDERPFEVGRFQEHPLCHRWDIHPDIRRDIRPHNDSYEYINGAFRPDTRKLLELLSGTQLYHSEWIAIRELLQNAFDAVREQIAYERLLRTDPGDPKWNSVLGNIHEVKLQLESEDDQVWLVCTDDGVGMSKNVIASYLLVSGTSGHPDVRELERACRSVGFELGRTGQFGIGVLSYFMIADFVQFRTRRSSLAPDAEATGWSFETEGIGSFGELRKETSLKQGTVVRLRLKHSFLERIEKRRIDSPQFYDSTLDQQLIDYVDRILGRIPCNFRFEADSNESSPLVFQPGWVNTKVNSLRKLTDLEDVNVLRQSSKRRQFTKENQQDPLITMIKSSLNWKTISGSLPENLGEFRIHIPEFQLALCKSKVFALIDEVSENKTILRSILHKFFVSAHGGYFLSWKGMRVANPFREPGPSQVILQSWLHASADNNFGIVEVDFETDAAGTPSVSRETVNLSERGLNALKWVKSRIVQDLDEFCKANRDSEFSFFSSLVVGMFDEQQDQVARILDINRWFYADSHNSDPVIWGPLQFPVFESGSDWDDVKDIVGSDRFEWNNQLVYHLLTESAMKNWNNIWLTEHPDPDRLLMLPLLGGSLAVVVPIWTSTCPPKTDTPFHVRRTQFPPTWAHIVGVQQDSDDRFFEILWNREHKINQYEDKSIEWLLSEDPDYYYPSGVELQSKLNEVKDNVVRARTWLIFAFASIDEEEWSRLFAEHSELIKSVWRLTLGVEQLSLSDVNAQLVLFDGNGVKLRILTPFSFQTKPMSSTEVNSLFTSIGSDWILKPVP